MISGATLLVAPSRKGRAGIFVRERALCPTITSADGNAFEGRADFPAMDVRWVWYRCPSDIVHCHVLSHGCLRHPRPGRRGRIAQHTHLERRERRTERTALFVYRPAATAHALRDHARRRLLDRGRVKTPRAPWHPEPACGGFLRAHITDLFWEPE